MLRSLYRALIYIAMSDNFDLARGLTGIEVFPVREARSPSEIVLGSMYEANGTATVLVAKSCGDAIMSFPFVSCSVVDGDKESWLFIRPRAGDAWDNTGSGAVSGIKGACSSHMPLFCFLVRSRSFPM